jgi:hypothetical protein
MLIRIFLSSFFFTVVSNCYAATNLSETFDVFWEMQWHQSGFPINARKWDLNKERKLNYSINTGASKATINYVQEALTLVSAASGIEFVQVDEKDDKVQIEFLVRWYKDEELRSMPCATNGPYRNWFFYKTKVSISEQQAYRCSLHEMMHAMGLSGHPLGNTVLTYFGGNRTKLSDIDQFILKYWHSDLITPGMNIFLVLKKLNQQWIYDKVPVNEQVAALEAERIWLAKTLSQMDAFADNNDVKGEPPQILYRSGRLSDAGLKSSRLFIQGILGVAYLEGYGVEKTPSRASELLMRGAQGGSSAAVSALIRGLINSKFTDLQHMSLCAWVRDAPLTNGLSQGLREEALSSRACQ